MESEFLRSLVTIFGASALVVFLLHRVGIPSVAGFLVAGVLIGPSGIAIVENTHSVEIMAEIGVILLLFTVGLEFSLSALARMKKEVVTGGCIQVLLTIGVAAVAAYFATGQSNRSVFSGFLVALSSTAIVLKLLAEKGETDSPHGRIMVGILIFQDLCVILLMLLTPALAGEVVAITDVAAKIGKAVVIIAVVLFGARWFVPELLHQVVKTRSRELFIITIILLCLGIALFTSQFGLSLALGAFLAGLIISESEYAHQATSEILPFKDSFIGLFFVSVGMLMDLRYMTAHCLEVALAVALIFGIKAVTGFVAALVAGGGARASLQAGFGLAQIGEFSFVLAIAGRETGLITEDFYQIFLSSSVLTMIMTPFVMNITPSLSAWVTSRHLVRRLEKIRKVPGGGAFPRKKHGHVIIIGFGLNGRNLARVLREVELPYVVLEMNSDTVLEMKKRGEPIYYGDGTGKEILRKLGVEKAKLLVVAISDPASTRRIVSLAKQENPGLYCIVRTRYLAEVNDLKKLGADEVIPEEFETSIEIFARVLSRYEFPRRMILEMVEKIRSDSYTALRSMEPPRRYLFGKGAGLPEIDVDAYQVPEDSPLTGKTIGELQIRKRTGVTVIAVRRGAELLATPEPDFRFRRGDVIFFTGEAKNADRAVCYFTTGSWGDPLRGPDH